VSGDGAAVSMLLAVNDLVCSWIGGFLYIFPDLRADGNSAVKHLEKIVLPCCDSMCLVLPSRPSYE
jgi:hypothetical protein